MDSSILRSYGMRGLIAWHGLQWLVMLLALAIILPLIASIPLRPRLFSLQDASIMQPPHSDSISYGLVVFIGVFFPFLIYALSAFVFVPSTTYADRLPPFFRVSLAYHLVYAHTLAVILVVLSSELCKRFSHALRPDFFARCMDVSNGVSPADGTYNVNALLQAFIARLVAGGKVLLPSGSLPPSWTWTSPSDAATVASMLSVPYSMPSTSDCPTMDTARLEDGMKSFVSGHSSMAFCTMTLLALFLYRCYVAREFVGDGAESGERAARSRLPSVHGHGRASSSASSSAPRHAPASAKPSPSELSVHSLLVHVEVLRHIASPSAFPHLFVWAPLFFALFVSASRLFDHRHHPLNVLLGGALGAFIAWLIWRCQESQWTAYGIGLENDLSLQLVRSAHTGGDSHRRSSVEQVHQQQQQQQQQQQRQYDQQDRQQYDSDGAYDASLRTSAWLGRDESKVDQARQADDDDSIDLRLDEAQVEDEEGGDAEIIQFQPDATHQQHHDVSHPSSSSHA